MMSSRPPGHLATWGCDRPTATGASVYIWEGLSCAKAFFTPAMLQAFEQTFGCGPTLRHVDTLMTIDNVADEVSVFDT